MSWLSGWSYRKQFTINHTDDGAQSGYHNVLKVYRTTGTDGTETIKNVAGGKVYVSTNCASDYDDIRITSSDGETLLPYYIRWADSNYAIIWIKATIPAHPDNFTGYIYYKGTETAVSSISTTFVTADGFPADDFEWGSDEDNIDTSGGNVTWSKVVAGPGTVKVDTSQAWQGSKSVRSTNGSSGGADYYCARTVGSTYAVNFMIRAQTAAQEVFIHGNGTKCTYAYIEPTTLKLRFYYGGNTDTGYTATADTWEEHELNNFNFTTYKFDWWFEGTKIASSAAMLTNATGNGQMYFQAAALNSSWHMDSMLIRKWTANEPTWGTWGAEEALPPIRSFYYPHILAH